MITKFDKNGAIALNKRRFGECLAQADYEGALDCLIKYSEAKDNLDFHMACGMLYLLMSQDSDDNELFALAFREFLMHLIRHPDCKAAYRNLLAVVFLRHEPMSMVEAGVWIKACGFETGEMLDRLMEVGISMFMGDGDMIDDIENLFLPGEFGEIDPAHDSQTSEPPHDQPTDKPKQSKVIKFKPQIEGETADRKLAESRITRPFDDRVELTEEMDLSDALELFSKLAEDDEWEEDSRGGAEYDRLQSDEIKSHIVLRNAEQLVRAHKLDKALAVLDGIEPDGGRIQYYAECLRAHIFIDCDILDEAKKCIDRAREIKRDGALAGTLLCKLYELTGKTKNIPDILKGIELTDFMDADHVYKAARLAINYCTTDDMLDLLEDYIGEYNVMDVRLLYAQVLYNSGEKELATDELYALTRIFYDDFNVRYYYLMARSDASRLPVDEEAPQNVIATLVDGFMGLVLADAIDREVIESDAFMYGLEMFVSLEFDNVREVVVPMFRVLHTLAKDKRLVQKMNDVLVSPYVEPIVKAIILGEL
ncbi:MAG: hypothetical protein J1G04_07380, partial [Clostridiales bacterium]|nr:hypothetical protein [Clostridiales bacterium]